MITAHLDIKGKVQGVFFRGTAKKIAEKYRITGWIKNTVDGNVEAMITGEKSAVEMFIDWCKKGPENAEVDEVEVSYPDEISFKAFTVIR
ncbi:MAG: acylphosphatase [Bacteroidota bacterium]|nr:acylphosphatase [Bacteroidota bacterium]